MGSLGVVVKTLPARLDAADLAAFQREWKALVKRFSARGVGFEHCEVLGSPAIEFLLECLSRIVRRDGDMKLAAISPESAAPLSLTRVERFFEIFRTVEDAVIVSTPSRQRTISSPSHGMPLERRQKTAL